MILTNFSPFFLTGAVDTFFFKNTNNKHIKNTKKVLTNSNIFPKTTILPSKYTKKSIIFSDINTYLELEQAQFHYHISVIKHFKKQNYDISNNFVNYILSFTKSCIVEGDNQIAEPLSSSSLFVVLGKSRGLFPALFIRQQVFSIVYGLIFINIKKRTRFSFFIFNYSDFDTFSSVSFTSIRDRINFNQFQFSFYFYSTLALNFLNKAVISKAKVFKIKKSKAKTLDFSSNRLLRSTLFKRQWPSIIKSIGKKNKYHNLHLVYKKNIKLFELLNKFEEGTFNLVAKAQPYYLASSKNHAQKLTSFFSSFKRIKKGLTTYIKFIKNRLRSRFNGYNSFRFTSFFHNRKKNKSIFFFNFKKHINITRFQLKHLYRCAFLINKRQFVNKSQVKALESLKVLGKQFFNFKKKLNSIVTLNNTPSNNKILNNIKDFKGRPFFFKRCSSIISKKAKVYFGFNRTIFYKLNKVKKTTKKTKFFPKNVSVQYNTENKAISPKTVSLQLIDTNVALSDLTQLKTVLSIITGVRSSVYFLNAHSLARFSFDYERAKKASSRKKTSQYFLVSLEREMYSRFRYVAVYIQDLIRISFFSLYLKKLDYLISFFAFTISKLPRNRKETQFIKFLIKLIKLFASQRKEIIGLRLRFKGRVNRWRRTKYITGETGRAAIYSYTSRREYSSAQAITRKGALGVHLWISYQPYFTTRFSRSVFYYVKGLKTGFFKVYKSKKI